MNDWRTSSYCTASNCVQLRRASDCATSTCVEVGHEGDDVLVRDSKNPEQAPLRFTADEWRAFLAGAKAGEFDLECGHIWREMPDGVDMCQLCGERE